MLKESKLRSNQVLILCKSLFANVKVSIHRVTEIIRMVSLAKHVKSILLHRYNKWGIKWDQVQNHTWFH